jgi:hypothetical protein
MNWHESKAAHTPYVSSASRRMQRCRAKHPRIDYFPSPDVLAIIEHHRASGGEKCTAGILDGLIRAGHRSVTGNGAKR